MYSDPQTMTFEGAAKTLARTGTGTDSGSFATGDRVYQLNASHSYGKRTRRVVKLKADTLIANPLIQGQNISQSASVHLVVDTPSGYSTAAAKAIVDGFTLWLTASSGANVSKLLGGES